MDTWCCGKRQRTHHSQLQGNIFGRPTERNQPRRSLSVVSQRWQRKSCFPLGCGNRQGTHPLGLRRQNKGPAWPFDVLRYCQKHGFNPSSSRPVSLDVFDLDQADFARGACMTTPGDSSICLAGLDRFLASADSSVARWWTPERRERSTPSQAHSGQRP